MATQHDDERRHGAARQPANQIDKSQHPQNEKPESRDETPSFSGDIPGGDPGAGADLGRGGTSTPAGDIAGGGQPGTLVDIGEGTASSPDAIPTGGAGDLAERHRSDARREELRDGQPAPRERSTVDGAPGIPAGSPSVAEALKTPDSELGGVIASDTTPGGRTDDAPSPSEVAEDDRKRNTL